MFMRRDRKVTIRMMPSSSVKARLHTTIGRTGKITQKTYTDTRDMPEGSSVSVKQSVKSKKANAEQTQNYAKAGKSKNALTIKSFTVKQTVKKGGTKATQALKVKRS